MAIRLRYVDGQLVALCAARSVKKEHDIYMDDEIHHALAQKFALDFNSEDWGCTIPYDEEAAKIIEAEEDNNASRVLWEIVYGDADKHIFTVGHTVNYRKAMLESDLGYITKAGRDDKYQGGIAFPTVEEAYNYLVEHDRLAIWSIWELATHWIEGETVHQVEGEDFYRLIHDARILWDVIYEKGEDNEN